MAIDDSARLRHAISGGGSFLPTVLTQDCVKLGQDIGRSFLHKKFVSAFGYVAAFSNADDSKLSDVIYR